MKTVFALMVLYLFSAGCSSNDANNAKDEKENYQLTKEKLEEKEKKSPAMFLTVGGNEKHNLIGQTVVKGVIKNNATVAAYKDIAVKLDFYSKTGTLLETDKETIYENIRPGTSKEFKTKYFAPKGTDSVALQILGAKSGEK